MPKIKSFIVHFKGKKSEQFMELQARDSGEARMLAERAQFRRHERFPLTFDRIQQAHERGDLDEKQLKAELERRKRDQGRYDDGELKIVSVKEVK
jgi:hypothetical protein